MNPTSLHTVRRTVAPALLGLLVLATAACGSSADADDDVPLDPAGATCLEGTEDCNDTDLPIDDPDPSAGMCAPDVTDCDDTGIGSGAAGGTCLVGSDSCDDTAAPADGGDPDAVDEGAFIRAAEAVLGTNEAALPDDVRVARRGDEQFALTEDYVIGRITVDLDDTDGSGYRVVAATVELTDGPRTVELTPG
ncbi:MAG: hypothetical protein KDB37_17520 [Ilumatobacter sp.]|nr:hypothetical protein [Ilumatobacter sp.]